MLRLTLIKRDPVRFRADQSRLIDCARRRPGLKLVAKSPSQDVLQGVRVETVNGLKNNVPDASPATCYWSWIKSRITALRDQSMGRCWIPRPGRVSCMA